MKVQDIITLYDYNQWAAKLILAMSAQLSAEQYLKPISYGRGSLCHILVHTLDTEWGWRMLYQYGKHTPDMDAAAFPTVEALAERWREEEADMRAYLAGLRDEDLTQVVRYTVNDVVREWILWHILMHVLNHGMQHRSEAAMILSGYGQSPGDLDFMRFLREQEESKTGHIPKSI